MSVPNQTTERIIPSVTIRPPAEISTSESNKHLDIRYIDPVIVINTWISEILTQ